MWDVYFTVVPWVMSVVPTWSILRRSGISDTLKQHSWGDLPDSGRTCNAFTVNYEIKGRGYPQWYEDIALILNKRKEKNYIPRPESGTVYPLSLKPESNFSGSHTPSRIRWKIWMLFREKKAHGAAMQSQEATGPGAKPSPYSRASSMTLSPRSPH